MQVGETQPESPPAADRFTPNVIKQTPSRTGYDLSWSDAEDTLTGAITPAMPMEGQPFVISVRVGTFQGKDFDGPVRFIVRGEGQPPMEQLVKRGPEERAWAATFVPAAEGHHLVEISFSSSRNKVLTAGVEVQGGRMPRWPWYVFAAVLLIGGIGAGVRFAKKDT